MRRGFITVATGKEEYYQLARNLLYSYRYFCKEPEPFAILCDQKNEYTKDFDDVIIYKNGATNSYLDKLSLGEYLPYEETIFIDADCLAFGDLNRLFDYFLNADDFSCFGRVLPLNDKTGWFEYENLGVLQSQVSYVVGLHGGIYYMKNSEMTRKVFDDAKAFLLDYPKFKFKGKFDTPGDEPLIALAMAVNKCHPVPFQLEAICCYWEYLDCIDIDITKGKAKAKMETPVNTILVHWGTRYTRSLEYCKQLELLKIMISDDDDKNDNASKCKKHYDMLIIAEKRQKSVKRVMNKIKRILGMK